MELSHHRAIRELPEVLAVVDVKWLGVDRFEQLSVVLGAKPRESGGIVSSYLRELDRKLPFDQLMPGRYDVPVGLNKIEHSRVLDRVSEYRLLVAIHRWREAFREPLLLGLREKLDVFFGHSRTPN